jgi:hypothetical protein
MKSIFVLLAISFATLVPATHLPSVGMAAEKAADQGNCPNQPTGVAQFNVTKTDTGYAVLLPPGLLKKFPYRADYRITLTPVSGDASTVRGSGLKDGDNFLNLSTSQNFAIDNLNRNNLRFIDVAVIGDGGGSALSCTHCDRDPELYCYDGDCTICTCEAPKRE